MAEGNSVNSVDRNQLLDYVIEKNAEIHSLVYRKC